MQLGRFSTSQFPFLRSIIRSFSSRASESVQNHSVSFTIVDKEGIRHPYKGVEGTPLNDVLSEIDEMRDKFMICAPGGRGSWDTHVYVTKEVMQALPSMTSAESYDLQETANDVNVNSRMASAVKLTRDLDGAVFALGNVRPWMTR